MSKFFSLFHHHHHQNHHQHHHHTFWVSHWLSHFTSSFFYQLLKRSFVYVFLRRSNISTNATRFQEGEKQRRSWKVCLVCNFNFSRQKKKRVELSWEEKKKISSFFQHFRFAINLNSSKSRPPRCPVSSSFIFPTHHRKEWVLIANWLFTNAC